MKKLIAVLTCAVALTFAAYADTNTVTKAVVDPSWAITLGGAGATTTGDGADTGFGVDLSIGRYGQLLLPVEYGLRQSLSYEDGDVVLSTRLYNDWTVLALANKKIDLFAGGAVGLTYGNTKPIWTIAPEGGVRWWVKKDVAIVGRVEVPFDMVEWKYNDVLRYFVGFQVKF